jgi:hypothetical protein
MWAIPTAREEVAGAGKWKAVGAAEAEVAAAHREAATERRRHVRPRQARSPRSPRRRAPRLSTGRSISCGAAILSPGLGTRRPMRRNRSARLKPRHSPGATAKYAKPPSVDKADAPSPGFFRFFAPGQCLRAAEFTTVGSMC